MDGKNRKGMISAASSAIIYGLIPMLVAFTTDTGIGTYLLIFVKNLFSLPLLFSAALVIDKRSVLSVSRKDFGQCILLMLLGCVLTLILLFPSYEMIGTAAATSLHFCYPVVILVVGAVFFKDQVQCSDIICFALCVAGVAFLYTREEGSTSVGAFMALGSGVAYGLYSLLIEKFEIVEKLGNYVFLFWVNALSLILFLPICLITKDFRFDFSVQIYLLLILISILDSILPSVLYQTGIRLIGSRKSALLGTLEPATSVLIGIVVLKEGVTVRNLLGMALIIAASVLLVVFSRKAGSR